MAAYRQSVRITKHEFRPETKKAEPAEKKVEASDITDSRGNVTRIAKGFTYVVNYPDGVADKMPASEAMELLDGYRFDSELGMFVYPNNRNRRYRVTLAKKKK